MLWGAQAAGLSISAARRDARDNVLTSLGLARIVKWLWVTVGQELWLADSVANRRAPLKS